MKEDDKNKFDLKIDRLKRIAVILGAVGLFLLALIFLFDLSYPNILFSILATISLVFVFASAGIYIAAWLMDIGLAYRRKQYILLVFLILSGLILIFLNLLGKR